MKIYFLLRDNNETGPFELEEIKGMNLKPFDLIWIEGQSNGWKYPGEITELAEFVCKKENVDNIPEKTIKQSKINHGKSRVFVALPTHVAASSKTYKTTDHNNEEVVLETKYSIPLDVIKERYVEHLTHKKPFFKNTLQKPNALWLVGLFGGLLLGAVMVKKIVDGLDNNMQDQTATSAAIIPYDEYKQSTYNFPEATEAISLDTVVEEKPKIKKINLTKMVSIEKSDFTVGVFGGVNNLQLTVRNNSPYQIDNVIVAVEYLKPNGEVVNKDKIEVTSINPGNKKTISVPASKRGVKVNTMVTKVSSKKYKAALLQL